MKTQTITPYRRLSPAHFTTLAFLIIAWIAGVLLLTASNAQAQNLFETSSGDGSIYEFTTNGVQSTFASGLSSPHGLAFDSAGDLFVADTGNHRILEFTNNGT
jgi:sugar lactone lactonase YvrE